MRSPLVAQAPPGTAAPPSRRRSRWVGPLVTVGALGASAAYVGLRDPYAPGFFPPCGWYALTGVYCPGCGGLRATHELLGGDVAAALSMNPLVVVLVIPAVALGVSYWLAATAFQRVPPLMISPVAAWSVVGVLLVFWALRNMTLFAPYLAPGGGGAP